ncbi:putative hydrolase [Lophiotrema nucula]|uniref:Putative hydrolase n=1 Tax=Lophiotrema nucula TaxID=690887 RepID=A0A6A5ZDM7_9PLEO|nr:putative hydrolase [Lophiotrema nucula]
MTVLHFLLASLVVFLHLVQCQSADLSNFDDWYHQRIQLDDVSIHFRYYGSGPPVLLVHGFPEHSLTWHTIGPILAQNYTVIVPDNRGCGDSSLSASGNYTAPAGGSDLKAILDFLNINQTFVFAHDKGVGLATSLAIEHPEIVSRIILAEYPLPGYGYTTTVTSSNLYLNWQLAFFAVPDAAEFFISGREKQMLSWYFFHSSYSGMEAMTEDHLNRYTTQISKPGFLRSGMSYFAAAWDDEAYFTSAFSNGNRLHMPMLALGGEASFSPVAVLNQSWSGVSNDFTAESVPKAGHWIGDENPVWCGNRALRFFGDGERIPDVDLSYLTDRVTLQSGALG